MQKAQPQPNRRNQSTTAGHVDPGPITKEKISQGKRKGIKMMLRKPIKWEDQPIVSNDMNAVAIIIA